RAPLLPIVLSRRPLFFLFPVITVLNIFTNNSILKMRFITGRFNVLKFLIYLVLFSFSWPALATQSWAAVGDVNYISDVVNVPLRSGPSQAHRIVHRGLPSGTQLTILAIDDGAGFTKVRTANGLEGWVTSQYLSREPIARVKLAAAEKRLQGLTAELEKE